MNNIITCQNCWTKQDCRTCQYRPAITETDIENESASRLLGKMFYFGIICLAIGLIIATTIYL